MNTYHVFRRSFIAILMFLSTMLNAQVVIKEKIEIKPEQQVPPMYLYSADHPLFSIRTDYMGPRFPYLKANTPADRSFTVHYSFSGSQPLGRCGDDPIIVHWSVVQYFRQAYFSTTSLCTEPVSCEGTFQCSSGKLGFALSEEWGLVTPNSVVLNSAGDTATFTYKSVAMTGSLTISLTPNQVDHFEVKAIRDTISYGEHTAISVRALDWYGNEVMLDDNTSISLYQWDLMPTPIGRISPDNSSFTYSQFKNGEIQYYADQTIPTQDEYVIFQVSNDNNYALAVGDGFLVVQPPCPFLQFSKTEIMPGDTVSITVLGKTGDNALIPYPANQLFDFDVVSGQQYGILKCGEQNGSTLMGVTIPVLYIANAAMDVDSTQVQIRALPSNVVNGGSSASSSSFGTKDMLRMPAELMLKKQVNATQSEAKKEIERRILEKLRIRLYASKEKTKNKTNQNQNGIDQLIAKVDARLAGTNTVAKLPINTPMPLAKTGRISMSTMEGVETCDPTATVMIEKPKLKIVDHSPWTIWPYLPTQSDGKNRGADLPGYNPKRSFRVQLQDPSGKPIANRNIKLKTTFTLQSGGHQHSCSSANVELPPTKIQGLFYYKGRTLDNPIVVTTGNDGIALVDSFRASQFSGEYLLTASLTSDTTVYDTVHVQVMVPGLCNFKQHMASENDWTYTYPYDQSTQCHADNHQSPYWLDAKATDSLTCVAFAWNDWCNQNGFEEYAILSLNDMSLEWGGAFEYEGRWNVDNYHSFHRVGCSVDINGTAWYFKDKDKQILTPLGKQLKKIMKRNGGKPYSEGSIHYGFHNQY